MYHLQSKFNRLFSFLVLFSLIVLYFPYSAAAADIALTWDANTEPDIAGYKVYYGITSRSYDFTIDAGNTTNCAVNNLEEGATYYFAATAYDTADNESQFSEEITYTFASKTIAPNSAPNTPTSPAGPSTGDIATVYGYSTSAADPDGDALEFRFDWGDGSISDWSAANSRQHTFSTQGGFCVRAQAIDIQGALSGWSSCLDVNIVPQTYTLSVSSTPNGIISPTGPVTVNQGADQVFSILPDPNYQVADVLVDGVSIGSANAYTFTDITRDHSISASFARENQPPVADAGADQMVRAANSVRLDGNNSSDPDGDRLSYRWSFASWPDGSDAILSDRQGRHPALWRMSRALISCS